MCGVTATLHLHTNNIKDVPSTIVKPTPTQATAVGTGPASKDLGEGSQWLGALRVALSLMRFEVDREIHEVEVDPRHAWKIFFVIKNGADAP